MAFFPGYDGNSKAKNTKTKQNKKRNKRIKAKQQQKKKNYAELSCFTRTRIEKQFA